MASQVALSESHRAFLPEQQPWYAIRTKSRHERTVCKQLEMDGLEFYLPTVQQARQWSDRTKVIEAPIFPGYVFLRIRHFASEKVQILRKAGVIGFVGNERGAVTIPDTELNGVRLLLANRIPYASHPYLKIGQRVRVTDGVLRGVEGILVGFGSKNGLVVSIELIQRSLVIQLQGYGVEAI
jgi:transcription termination/antitermination protein NusG